MNASKILIRNAKVVDPNSPHDGKSCDLLIEDNIIVKIDIGLSGENCKIIQGENLHLSPGWFDLRANFCDPGNEHREDIKSGINAAIKGGFTGIALSPETEPVIDSKADIEYIYTKAGGYPISVYPYGAFSKGLKGEELSEMHDMFNAGAVGFSHGKKAIPNAALMKLALLYAKSFAPPIHVFSMDKSLAYKGQMHEGINSTSIGLKGIPALAEETQILRDLRLAEYTETAIHFMGISSRQSLDILRSANNYTADISIANLFFTDKDLSDYDTNLKTLPPLRSKEDHAALIQALKEGMIQAVASDHTPIDIENKHCEFDRAAFGMITLESFFGALWNQLKGHLSLSKVIELIAINPRKILQLEVPVINEGRQAEISLFNPDIEYTFQKEMLESKSFNSPFIGKKLKGRVLGTINNGVLVWLS